jgi:hypothetical protein
VGGLVGVVDGGTVGESVLVGASVPGTSVDGGTVGRFEGLQVGGLVGGGDGGTVGGIDVQVGASVLGTSVDGGTVGRFEGLQVGGLVGGGSAELGGKERSSEGVPVGMTFSTHTVSTSAATTRSSLLRSAAMLFASAK